MNENWLNARQVAGQLGVAVTTVYALCQARRLAHIRIGNGRGAIRISAAALEEYIGASAVAADASVDDEGGHE